MYSRGASLGGADCDSACYASMAQMCKITAEKSPYWVEKLNVFVMPTLVLIKDGQTVHHIRGFDEFGGTDSFGTEAFAYVLSTYKVSLSSDVLQSSGIDQRVKL